TVIPHNQILAIAANLSSGDATHPCRKCDAGDNRGANSARDKPQRGRLSRIDCKEYCADRRHASGVGAPSTMARRNQTFPCRLEANLLTAALDRLQLAV